MTAPTTFVPDEVDSLLQEIAESNDTWAAGAALYGAGGTFDATRKARLSILSAEIRDGYTEKGEKVTEARIDELAHSHPDYVTFLDESTRDRALWLALDAERRLLDTRVNLYRFGVR